MNALALTAVILFLGSEKPTLVLPLAGEIRAANGNRFTTTIEVEGGGTTAFFPSGAGAMEKETVRMPAPESALPWKQVGRLGAVEMEGADSASATIVHLDPAGRVIGRLVANAVAEASGLRAGDKVRADFPPLGWRTNLVLFESSNRPVAIEIISIDQRGKVLEQGHRTLGAHEHRLLPLSAGVAKIHLRVLRGPGRIHFGVFSTNVVTGEIVSSNAVISRRASEASVLRQAAALLTILLMVFLTDRRRLKAARAAGSGSS